MAFISSPLLIPQSHTQSATDWLTALLQLWSGLIEQSVPPLNNSEGAVMLIGGFIINVGQYTGQCIAVI